MDPEEKDRDINREIEREEERRREETGIFWGRREERRVNDGMRRGGRCE